MCTTKKPHNGLDAKSPRLVIARLQRLCKAELDPGRWDAFFHCVVLVPSEFALPQLRLGLGAFGRGRGSAIVVISLDYGSQIRVGVPSGIARLQQGSCVARSNTAKTSLRFGWSNPPDIGFSSTPKGPEGKYRTLSKLISPGLQVLSHVPHRRAYRENRTKRDR